MSQDRDESSGVQSRVGAAERQIASLTAQQQALTESVGSVAASVERVGKTMADGFQRVDNQIDSLGSKLAEQGKPQWQTLVALFGVVVVVVGWFAKSEIAPLDTEQRTLKAYVSDLRDRAGVNDDRHSAMRERIARLEEIRRLDEAGLLRQRGSR